MKFEIDRNKFDKALKNGFGNMLYVIISIFGAMAFILITFAIIYSILILIEKCGIWYGVSIGIIIVGIIAFIFGFVEDLLGW